MNRPARIILAALVLLATGAAGVQLGRLMQTAPPAVPQVQTATGDMQVALTPDQQRAAGIDVASLSAAPMDDGMAVNATVIDLQPLFDLAGRVAAARAERDSVRAQAAVTAAQQARSELLYQDDRNVSLKSTEEARSAARSDQARLRAARAALAVQEAHLRLQFGPVLENAAADPASDLLRRLADGRAAVLRLTVAPGATLAPGAQAAVDAPDGQRRAIRQLSAAPQADPALQGAAYFYLIEPALPAGTRTTGHIATGKASAGLLIPSSAIVWSGGQRWAYVRAPAARFTRRLVTPQHLSDDGVVTMAGFKAGDLVVVRGAQLLLSDEQRPQDIATVCKDPPECDD